jgi:hypothetical protein
MYAASAGTPRFSADWHPSLGPVLQFFPRCLRLGRHELWPDFATLLDDGTSATMLYQPHRPSRVSASVVYHYASGSWQTRVYADADLLFQVEGGSYDGVMGVIASAQTPVEPT